MTLLKEMIDNRKQRDNMEHAGVQKEAEREREGGRHSDKFRR